MTDASVTGIHNRKTPPFSGSMRSDQSCFDHEVDAEPLQMVKAVALRIESLATRARQEKRDDLHAILIEIANGVAESIDDIVRYRSGLQVVLRACELIDKLERVLPPEQ